MTEEKEVKELTGVVIGNYLITSDGQRSYTLYKIRGKGEDKKFNFVGNYTILISLLHRLVEHAAQSSIKESEENLTAEELLMTIMTMNKVVSENFDVKNMLTEELKSAKIEHLDITVTKTKIKKAVVGLKEKIEKPRETLGNTGKHDKPEKVERVKRVKREE